MKKRFHVRMVVGLLGCAALFVAVVAGVRTIGEKSAWRQTETLLDYACDDLPTTLRGMLSSSVLLVVETLGDELSVTNPPSVAEMRRIEESSPVDELYLVDRYGRVLASADPELVGYDLTTIPAMMDFLSLVECPDLSIEQPVRLSITGADKELSYRAFPRTDGSLLLCGFDIDHLRQNFVSSCKDLMSSWAIGETGGYVVIDETTGRLVFDVLDQAKAGELFSERGDSAALTADLDVDATHTGVIFGRLCHYRIFGSYGLRIVAYVGHDDFFHSVVLMVRSVAVMLILVFLVFGYVFRRVVLANRAIAQMREAEDRQRIKDMVMATSIQKHSLPTTFPPYPNRVGDFDIYAFMQTAREVGGDFYDFYFVAPEKVALVVADVSGKGVPAAMFMMRAKTTIQGLLKSGAPLVEAMAKANDHLREGNLEDMFVTAWVGICDLTTGVVEYVNAGHNPPLVRRKDGSVEWIRARSGLVLAAMEGMTYRSHTLSLAPGDGLVLYTDGVTEAQNAAGELFGEERLRRVTLETNRDLYAHTYCDAVLASLSRFAQGAEQADDITMLAFRLERLVPSA